MPTKTNNKGSLCQKLNLLNQKRLKRAQIVPAPAISSVVQKAPFEEDAKLLVVVVSVVDLVVVEVVVAEAFHALMATVLSDTARLLP